MDEQRFAGANMGIDQKLVEQMQHVFEALDAEKIKAAVDKKGLDSVINEAATLAAITGAVAGLGGPITMIVGIPVSVVNTVAQQFRVTMAVIYVKKGRVTPSFNDFMKIVALSLGVEVGIGVTSAVLVNVAGQILARLGASSIGAFIPVFGAVVGGGANYAFIRSVGATLKKLEMPA